MDWNQVISVISDLVKDESTREQIYKRLLDTSSWSQRDDIEEECLGYDDAFDNVWEEFYSEEKIEIDEDNINYEEEE